MKKKIGIITFHDAYSYGAVLQCLGLFKYLENIGVEPYIIDYSSKGYKELRNKNKFKTVLRILYRYIKNPFNNIKHIINANKNIKKQLKKSETVDERNKKFDIFRNKYFTLSRRYTIHSDLIDNPPEYDAYICGSDQIWNPYFCDADSNYYLEFAPISKRIAYAPSFGVTNIPVLYKRLYKKRIKSIPYLSVREDTGREIVKNLCDIDAPVVIDPTFLIDSDSWRILSKETSVKMDNKYILTYFIGDDEYISKISKRIAKSYPNYEIINLIFNYTNYGPADFLFLIDNADFVFTNSFHGCAFCINFNTPFAIVRTLKDFSKYSAFTRIENLLHTLGLESRIIDDDTVLNDDYLSCDFIESNKRLKKEISTSKQFLFSSLENIMKDLECHE